MNVILVFMKYPEKGFVKTRIAKSLGDEFALKLYKNFIRDILKTCSTVDSDIIVMLYSETDKNMRPPLLKGYNCYRQEGADLGERMYNAFLKAFYFGYGKCVLIGSDIPDMPAGHITESYKALETNDIVLGPSDDGGYCLIGVKKESADPVLFNNIDWSTDCVLEETIKRINHKKMSLHLLDSLNDIDEPKDLNKFFELHKKDINKYYSMDFLSRDIFSADKKIPTPVE